VIIVGAGFGGMNAAKVLGNKKDVKVTLVDRRNYHLFQPLLYQVATAGLSPAEIATPIRTVMSAYENIQVQYGNVKSVDVASKEISTDSSTLKYDFLVLACGAKHSYFSHPEWEEFAPGLKTLEQATEIRRRILLAFELAERETNPEVQKKLLTFVVVGAGPTGVELAGAIGEISRFTLSKDFTNIDPSRTRIVLIEAGSRILSSFSESLSRKAARDLENLGVQIWTSTRVTSVDQDGVRLGSEVLNAATVLWAAGVQPSSIGKTLGTKLDRVGRVVVQPDLSIEGHPEVFVIGDQALVEDKNGHALAGIAPVAIQEGAHAGKNVLKRVRGEPTTPFKYLDKGVLATIGRKKAIGRIGTFEFSGFFAWAMWLFIHIYYLVGFKNRTFVFIQWAWSYLTFKRGARLIIHKEWKSGTPEGLPMNDVKTKTEAPLL
ncbi:MAG: NAD(P)/FAD-dependent oxidoreductase, partial [Bdellovibrionales bacterium]|nr:NAD(P)/FAD-dependent oxidoreductase [Bdellovibrionales bacterium]